MTTKGIGCRLQSEASNRVIEVTERGGKIGLRLGIADQPVSFYEGTLSSILRFSTGRPWRADRMAILEQKAEQLENGILLSIQGDSLKVRIEVTFDTDGFLRLETAWTNTSGRMLADASVGLEWELDSHDQEMITIPHMIYNNNPSADPDRLVPHLCVGEGKGLLCEEHRLPIPCVNVEWQEGQGHRFLSFFSLPSYVETTDGVVHYGSLGAYQRNGQTTIAAMSGVLMFNGEKDIVYVSKSKIAPYEGVTWISNPASPCPNPTL
ncbi:hypothetical protein N6H14_28180 [Paenibacillus sp. CC-CFT747]|nr:hypothetical protein N6H14_28180 [Paenibacillus sp. CC-CFT747]